MKSKSEWIYLKSANNEFDDFKAAALAAVLCKSACMYHVVHTSLVAKYLYRLKNVNIGYPKQNDSIIKLDLPDNFTYDIYCEKIAQELNADFKQEYAPYLEFIRPNPEVNYQLDKFENVVLFCGYTFETMRSLTKDLENVVGRLAQNKIISICCGSRFERFLSGSYDFRELIRVDEVIANRNKILMIVTAEPVVKEIACILKIPVVYLYTNVLIKYLDKKIEMIQIISNYSNSLFSVIKNNVYSNPQFEQNNVSVHKFEVPYNFDEYLLDYYLHTKNQINYIFLPPYAEDSINTRTCIQSKEKGWAYMPLSREEYEYHLQRIRLYQLKCVILWQDKDNIISKDLLDYYTSFGVAGFIVSNDANAQRIKNYNPSLKVICSIVQRVCAGISKRNFQLYDSIVMFYPFTRSLESIKKLSYLKDKMVIMPNAFCHADCLGTHHWFAKNAEFFVPSESCLAMKDESMSTFIRPEHLYLFDEYIGGYKLQGREWTTDVIITTCESFFRRKSLVGLIPTRLNQKLKKYYSTMSSLETYYNIKTHNIFDNL